MNPETFSSSQRLGRDELNLTEFPFALLSDRAAPDQPSKIEFKDGEKEWVVEGSATYGLPTAADVEIYVVLMELTREQGFPAQVNFCRYELFRRLGWNRSGRSYDRLLLSLRRLVGVTIRTQNAFYDAANREWHKERAFHILEEYEVNDSRLVKEDELSLFPSWIRWSREIYQNLHAGYLKRLDVGFFLSLESAISQALYRYLDAKRYDGKPQYRIGIRKLAWEHLGLSRNYNAAQIKRKLDVAHTELTERGFLLSAEYSRMRNGEEMAVYRFPTGASLHESEALTEDPLLGQLQAAGLSRKSAEELAEQDPEECRRQLEYLPHRGARDPGAVLVKAIREGWAAPPEWTKRQRRRKTREAAAEQPALEIEDPFLAQWTALPEERRQEIDAVAIPAVKRENRVAYDLGRKFPESPVWTAALNLKRREQLTRE